MLKHSNENDVSVKAQKNQSSEDIESQKKDQKRAKPSPKKDYMVTINYIRLTDNEARIKRAIVTSIMKKSHVYKDRQNK